MSDTITRPRASKYGWHLLTAPGASVTVQGVTTPERRRTARVSAQGYARRHGFAVSIADLQEGALLVTRTGS